MARPHLVVLGLLLGGVAVGIVALAIVLGDGSVDPYRRYYERLAAMPIDELEVANDGLPIVPVADMSRRWWWVDAPTDPLDPSRTVGSTLTIAAPADPAGHSVSLLVAFPDHAAARAIADELITAVGDADAEVAWLAANGQRGASGFDRVEVDAATAPFLRVIDRWLIVAGLAYRTELESWVVVDGRERSRYGNPLALALEDTAEHVLTEGDRSGEGAIAFDLTCRGGHDELVELAQELADHGRVRMTRPPWLDPPLTIEERRARRTYRLLSEVQGAAIVGSLLADDRLDQLQRSLTAAVDRGDDAAIRDASAGVRARLLESMPDSLPDLAAVTDVLDADVVSEFIDRYAASVVIPIDGEPDAPPTIEERRAEAERYGAIAAPSAWRSGDASYEIAYEDGRMDVFAGVWNGIAAGMPAFIDLLATSGCEHIDIEFHDFDDVRGD